MTPFQIRANQKLCEPHRFSYADINNKGPFALCSKGCGIEWGETDLYKSMQKEKQK